MSNPLIIIVGTGPSALAATAGVLKSGIRPVILDVSFGGINPDPKIFQLQPTISKRRVSKPSPGRKLWFGSDLPYRQHPNSRLKFLSIEPVPSFAFGGYSRIWGASCSFYRGMKDWPKKYGLLDRDHLLVSQLLGFNDVSLLNSALRQSSLAQVMIKIFSSPTLEKKYKVSFANLAINVDAGVGSGCRYCNECLSGCPYDAIWSSAKSFREMQESGAIDLKTGYFLTRIHVESGRVTELLFVKDEKDYVIKNPDYVYLGTGAISTAEILINSGLVQEVTIQDSSTAFSAMLKLGKIKEETANNHALSQLWITNRENGSHLQIYSPSPGLETKLIQNFPFLKKFPSLTKWLSERIIPVISYLEPEYSGKIVVKEKGSHVLVASTGGKRAKITHHFELMKLSSRLLLKGYLLPSLFSKIPNPGTGYHFGASMPMGKITNSLGQLPGITNMSIVDSSTLPNIEAGSITPTVMANAARISRIVSEKFKVS